jgi:hypothetical protein
MNEFLASIPAAAASPYALVAYAIAAVLFLLGGARLRTVQTVLKAIASVPPGDRKHVIESITGSVIPDRISAEQWIRHNRNRWVFLLIGTALILLTTLGTIAAMNPSGPGKAPDSEGARDVAKSWLAKMDAEQYHVAFDDMFVGFRQAHTLEWWVDASQTYRRPLGRVEFRQEANSAPSEFRLGRPLNGYTIMYFTKFEHLKEPIRETVQFVSPGLPEAWRVAGYTVDVPPDAPFFAKKEGK